MLKALLATHAVMLVCTIIPVAQLLLAPFGPFLGAYYGIRWVDTGQATPLAAAAKFGCAVGAVSALILTAIALILTLAIDLPPRFVILTWIAVGVFTLYVAGMSLLGAMYRLVKTQTAAGNAPATPSTAAAPGPAETAAPSG